MIEMYTTLAYKLHMQFNITPTEMYWLNWRYSFADNFLVNDFWQVCYWKQKRYFSFTSERWIRLFGIATIATANWELLPQVECEFADFWPRKIYSPNHDLDQVVAVM